jgi:hypothetical protein
MTRPTSNINYNAIVTTYPAAGVDNDSQGFRDNFTAIAAGLQQAQAEITALQQKTVLSAELTSNTATVNDLQASTISNGLFNQFYGVYFDGGTVATSANIDLNNGPVQKFTLSGHPTLTFTNWPDAGQSGIIRVHIASDQNGVRYPIFATENAGTIHYEQSFPINPVTSTVGFTVGGESVSSISVTNAGSGYTNPASISYSSGVSPITGGRTPTLTPTYKIVSAVIAGGSGGTGYAVNDTLTLNGFPNVLFTVSSISGGGGTGPIATISVTTGGSFAAPLPFVFGTSPLISAGTGARLALAFGVDTVEIIDGGDGYTTTPPTVTIAAPGGSGTQAQTLAVLTTNSRTRVKVIEAWSNNIGTDVYIRYLGEY